MNCRLCIQIVTVREMQLELRHKIWSKEMRRYAYAWAQTSCCEKAVSTLEPRRSPHLALHSRVGRFSSLLRWRRRRLTDTRRRCPPTASRSHSVQIHRPLHHHHVCQPFIPFTSLHSLPSISHQTVHCQLIDAFCQQQQQQRLSALYWRSVYTSCY